MIAATQSRELRRAPAPRVERGRAARWATPADADLNFGRMGRSKIQPPSKEKRRGEIRAFFSYSATTNQRVLTFRGALALRVRIPHTASNAFLPAVPALGRSQTMCA